MTALAPTMCTWTGEAFEPLPHFRKRCDETLVVHEKYWLMSYEERSDISHDHQFAWLAKAWATLPEDIAYLYPSPKHLRKRALISAGYYTETIVDAGTNAAALRVAAAVPALDEFAGVIVRGPIVMIRRAKSQKYRAMGRKEFQASKTAIMEIIAGMIGVKPEELQKAEAA